MAPSTGSISNLLHNSRSLVEKKADEMSVMQMERGAGKLRQVHLRHKRQRIPVPHNPNLIRRTIRCRKRQEQGERAEDLEGMERIGGKLKLPLEIKKDGNSSFRPWALEVEIILKIITKKPAAEDKGTMRRLYRASQSAWRLFGMWARTALSWRCLSAR